MIGRRVDKALWLLGSGEHEKARELLDGLADLLVRIAWARAPRVLEAGDVAGIAAEAARDGLAEVAPPPDDIRRLAQRVDLVRLLQVTAAAPLPGLAWLVANSPRTLPRDEKQTRELAAAVGAAAAECARLFGGLEPLVSADGAAAWIIPRSGTNSAGSEPPYPPTPLPARKGGLEREGSPPSLSGKGAGGMGDSSLRGAAPASPGLTPERRAELMLRAEGRERLHGLLDSLAGTRIDRFEIASLMAIGAQFAVYSARDTGAGKDVVIKLPRLDYDRPASFGGAEARRARAAARRSFEYLGLAPPGPFPRPVALVEARNPLLGEDRPGWMRNEELYLVEERVDGGTLVEAVSSLHRERAGGEPVIQAFAASLAGQLLGVFAALADGKPPLRFTDLGPRNIIVDPAGRLRLVDAGSLVRLDPPEPSAWVTLAYLPPDLAGAAARGEPVDVDEAALLHGLGRLVFYALTNREALPGREPDWDDARFTACAAPVRDLALGLVAGDPDFDPELAAFAAREAAGDPDGKGWRP